MPAREDIVSVSYTHLQMKVSLMGFEHVVSCLCECEVKARQELDEKMQWEEAQRQLYQRKSALLFQYFL